MELNTYFDQLDRQEAELRTLAAQLPAPEAPPAEGRWTALQELEHICLTENLVQKLLARPSDKQAETPELMGNAKLEKLVVGARHYKIVAPERLCPKGIFEDAEAFTTLFRAQRTALKEDLQAGRIVPDNRTFPHPVLGELTVSDWLYFLVHHTQRHLLSLRESHHLTTAAL